MRASNFEFRFRFWIIGGFFWIGSLVPRRWSVFQLLAYRLGHSIAVAICLLLFFSAAALRTWAAAYLKPEIIHSKDLDTKGLVADGPFRHVRNPLYLGTVLLGAGFGVLYGPLGFSIVVGGLFLLTMRLILREEFEMAASQGASYQDYIGKVPRIFPSLPPRVPAGTTAPNWPKAFRGELMFWLFLADVVLLFSLSDKVSRATQAHIVEIGAAVAMLTHLIVQPRRKSSISPNGQAV